MSDSNSLAQNAPQNTTALSTDFSPQWQQAAYDWLENFRSERTRAAYRAAWRAFLEFAGQHPEDVTQTEVINYRNHLNELGRAQATINQHLAAISSYYRLVIERGLRSDNPADGVKRLKNGGYNASWLTEAEQQQFIAAIPSDSIQGRRDRAMMLLFLTTGVRVSAIANLRYGDIQPNGDGTYFRYVNKGGKLEREYIAPPALAALNAYLADRDALQANDALFVATEAGRNTIAQTNAPGKTGGDAKHDQPLAAHTIYRLVRKYAVAALGKERGLQIHPHSLRHSVASRLIQTKPLADVSSLLRHSSTRVTENYVHGVFRETHDATVIELGELFSDPDTGGEAEAAKQ